MMKKLLLSLSLIGIFGWLISTASATSTSCKDVEFSNGVTACVNIVDAWTDRRSVTTDLNWGSTANLRCDIMTPDSQLRSISSCNGEFSYDVQKAGRVKLWIRYSGAAPITWEGKPSSNSEWTFPQWVYDFDNEERVDDNLTDSSSSNGDLDNFYVTTDDTTPSTSQYVDLTVEARDNNNDTVTNYTDSVNFKVYYRSSSSSTWTLTTSSTYYTMSSSYTNGYDFTSSNNGIKTFTNLIKFNRNNYDYKVRVYDENDTSIYKEITYYVGTSNNNNNSNGNLDNLYVTTDDTTPSTSQYVDLTVQARDSNNDTITDYTDSINFKVYYRSSSSSTWTLTTSSTYYTMSSSYTNGYDFSSSNNGIKTFTNLIKFNRNNYDYKVRVYDENDTSIYKEITYYVGTSNNNNNNNSNGDLDNFYLTTDDTTPSTSQYVDLTVQARDSNNDTITDYTDSINFKVYYRSSNSSTWTLTTSSTYYTMSSSYTNGYDFSSSNNGSKTFSNLIKFNRNNYDYKVRVYDENDTSIYKEITYYVGTSNNNNNSSINGFTSSELNTVEGIYNGRDNMITSLESRYSNLRNSTRRQTMGDDLKIAMREIVNNNNNKTYDNFDDFYTAWLDWYRYTTSIK